VIDFVEMGNHLELGNHLERTLFAIVRLGELMRASLVVEDRSRGVDQLEKRS